MSKGVVVTVRFVQAIIFCIFVATNGLAQAPITLTIDTSAREFAIPPDSVELGFETRSVVADGYGVRGNFFSPANTELITLFRNIGIRHIHVGGGTVDDLGLNAHCVPPVPSFMDIDYLFEFAHAAGIKVIYSVRLENPAACPNPHLAKDDAKIARYIWDHYCTDLDSFSIGNEPDVGEYHSRRDKTLDPAIYETASGIPGSAYSSYLAYRRHFPDVIRKAVSSARFSGSDTAVSSTSSFTPNPKDGVSWTVEFAKDLKGSGMLAEALQHHYLWGIPANTTATETLDDMLSRDWDDDSAIGTQPVFNGETAKFHPYPFVYSTVLAPLVAVGVRYRMTEANDCLHGVVGASEGFAAALWSVDDMHWWATHNMARVNFHDNPWLPTDTIVLDPNPCASSGCKNYHATPKATGMKAFSLGNHGFVELLKIANPQRINLTAFAEGTSEELYVTVTNKTQSATHDATAADVVIEAPGFEKVAVDSMVLTGDQPGNVAVMTGTFGGSGITNRLPWSGRLTPVGEVQKGREEVTV